MKPVSKNKSFKRYLTFFLSIISAFVLFALIRSLVPNAISYSVSENGISGIQAANAVLQKEDDTCLFSSLSDIKNDGPFSVKSDGEEIYILSDEKRLYRINAKLSDFPENDKHAIEKGLYAKDRRELIEIVSYMES